MIAAIISQQVAMLSTMDLGGINLGRLVHFVLYAVLCVGIFLVCDRYRENRK